MIQYQIREEILKKIKNNRMPNAICFIDRGGRGSLKLASEMALNIVKNLLTPPNELNFTHPDLHYVYPTKIPKNEKLFKKDMSAFYIDKWREFMSSQIYGSVDEWLDFSSLDNKTGTIRVDQISKAISILNLKPFQSDKKVCVIWGMKYLKEEGANKLLKIIEEPPKKTYFFLIGEDEKKIMPTIISRCQIIRLPPLGSKEIEENLIKMGHDASLALDASKISKGSLSEGVARINNEEITRERERLFIDCLRGCYMASNRADFSHVIKISNELGALNKSDLKHLFLFGINFIRQSFFYSNGVKKLYEFKSLNAFSIENFAIYVSKANYKKLISLFDLNLYYMGRNANIKLLSTSFLFELSNILYEKN
jgi:DNA polymerase-3 subunit delta'